MTDKEKKTEKQSMTIRPQQRDSEVNPQIQDGPEPTLPPEAQSAIGRQLRQVYGQMLSEPLPDKFAKLLEELSKSESK